MAFPSQVLSDPPPVSSGEEFGNTEANIKFTAVSPNFENGLIVGRFAGINNELIKNLDGSAIAIAGVVLRKIANAIESINTIDTSIFSTATYLRQGLVTVEVVVGQTPNRLLPVFVSNAGDANDGKVVTSAGAGIESFNAVFVREIKTDVWLILLQ